MPTLPGATPPTNGLEAQIVTADIAALPAEVRQRQFDHVFTNPPYFTEGSRSLAPDEGRESGRGEGVSMAVWLESALRRVAPNGRLTLIQRVDRLPEILSLLTNRLGGLTVQPISARQGRPAKHVLVAGLKSSNAPFRLLNPLILHDGSRHERDGESYAPDIQKVLRDAAPIENLQKT